MTDNLTSNPPGYDSPTHASPSNSPKSLGERFATWISLTVQHVAITAACLICLHVLLIWFANFDPVLELAVHFAFHSLVAIALVIPVLWLTKHKRTAAVCMIPATYLFFLVQPWIFFPWEGTPKQDVLRVLCWNVWASNHSSAEIEKVIREANPDVFLVIELAPGFAEEIPWLQETFPYKHEVPSRTGSGIGIYSRRAEVDFKTHVYGVHHLPAIIASIRSVDGSRKMDLVAMHTTSPGPPRRAIARDKQLRVFREWALEQTQPICLAGDLNTTPWTRSFAELKQAGFRDSRSGAGNCASWPAWLGPVGIPIDHALSRGDCVITNRRVVPVEAGSDHRPISFELSF
jgi:endonuclease/exonuclease/phosphatase (EEP) superfamily protein YafD